MTHQITPGKKRGLNALSDKRGVIAALAIDQRSALRKLFAKVGGLDEKAVPREWLVEFKEHVSKVLTPFASAILLDPEYGLPAARRRAMNSGLLLAYEKSGYDKSIAGRLPRKLDGTTVTSLKSNGADAVKVLLYYSPFSAQEINSFKRDWVTRIGEECVSADVAFFLELVSYSDDLDEKSIEFARLKPEIVTRSVEEFCNPRYAVDVLKIGVPVNMNFVESQTRQRSEAIYTRSDAIAHFRRASMAATLPFIYLSEGVANDVFVDALRLAAEAGSNFSGVLCGRATWQEGIPVFVKQGTSALEDWLRTEGVRNIQRVNKQLESARPWQETLFPTSQSGK